MALEVLARALEGLVELGVYIIELLAVDDRVFEVLEEAVVATVENGHIGLYALQRRAELELISQTAQIDTGLLVGRLYVLQVLLVERLVEDDLASRQHRDALAGLAGSLRGDVEKPDGIDLVAEELQSNGMLHRQGKDVDNASPNRELADAVHHGNALDAGVREVAAQIV